MKNAPAASFAALLRDYRLAAGLSQEALAERAGLSVRAISDLERGVRRAPYRETVYLLADALGLVAGDRYALEAAVNRRRGPLPGSQTLPESLAPTLPAAVTPLIGRGQEVAALRNQLRQGDTRLLTLSGPPGIGKTRLAQAIASAFVADRAEPVTFVGLAPIADPGLVATTILQALDVVDVGGLPPAERLKILLRDASHLLVLDNFEHVIQAAPLVADLLASSPGVRVVVTSRLALRLRGEHEFPVPPLTLPAPAIAPDALLDVGILDDFSAVRLFVERARAVKPGFALTEDNARVMVEICHRLDGLPLAIELAAARCKVLSLPAMLGRLEHRLQLLTDGARDAPERQRSLRAAIAWSYDLLAPEEQTLFRRLGIFVGGFTLEAAEWVAGSDEGSREGVPFPVTLDGIASLVDRSLVQQHDGADGESRFVMLETLREFALEQLDAADERRPMQHRHALGVLSLAEEAEPHLFTAARGEWLRCLNAEQDNIRAALGFALEQNEAQLGLRLVGALWMWFLRRLLVEGRRWAEDLLAHPGAVDGTAARASALFAAGHFAWLQGDVQTMRARLEECIDIRRTLGDAAGLGRALPFLGLAIGDDHQQSRRLAAEGVALCRTLDDQWGLAMALTNLGRIEATWGHDEVAAPALEEATTLFRAIGDGWLLALPLNSLGAIAYRAGSYERAQSAFEEALPCFRVVEDRRNTTQVLTNLAYVSLAQGNRDRARTLFTESLRFGQEHADRFNTPACLRGLAAIAAADGETARAVRLLAAADALFSVTGATRWPAERLHGVQDAASLRAHLGAEAFATAWESGRRLSLARATAEAIGETAHPADPPPFR